MNKTIERKKQKNLEGFMEKETAAKFGLYIYTGQLKFDRKKRIIYLPAWSIG